MKHKTISDAVTNISIRHIEEAADFTPKKKTNRFFKILTGKSIIAVTLSLCVRYNWH